MFRQILPVNSRQRVLLLHVFEDTPIAGFPQPVQTQVDQRYLSDVIMGCYATSPTQQRSLIVVPHSE